MHKNNIFICFKIYFQHHHIKTIQKHKKKNKAKKIQMRDPTAISNTLVLVLKYG
jgi:hypothetical protein